MSGADCARRSKRANGRSGIHGLVLALLTALVFANPGIAVGQLCPGDCNANTVVSIDELVVCSEIALGNATLDTCEAFDVDRNGLVSIADLITAVNAALTGCPSSAAMARFDLAASPLDWGDVPFPSDLYRDETGSIRIGALPVMGEELPLHSAMRDFVQTRDGFCATCNVYFPIEGDIDTATLPQGGEPSVNDGVVLVDVDPDSPERGRLFPLRLEWNLEHQRLALRPGPGIALHRSRHYAAALTTALHGSDGSEIRPSETFEQVRGTEASEDSIIESARSMLAPAFDELERIGIARERIVALAAFTTEDVTADVLGTRAAVQDGPPLEVEIERRRLGEEIDELLGIASEDRPGIEVPPAKGVAGTRSIAHESLAEVITGTFYAPRVLSGSGTDIGLALRDASGTIVAGAREGVPFLLTLPAEPAAAQVPIVIAHHGFNASRVTGFATANTAARAGVAVLAIDAFQHGERAASASDEVNAIRGNLPGADGFAETSTADVSARVFGLLGAVEGLQLFPAYSLGAFLQFSADIASAARIVRDGSLAAALQELGVEGVESFNAERIGFIGNSLGAVVGASVLVAEPDIRFAVQNVAPGSIVETLAQSPEFRPLVEALFLPIFGIEEEFDEIERHILFHPIIDLSRWILEPIDPLALAPYLLLDSVHPDGAPEILFQVAALDEVASTLATDSMLMASGSARVTRYDPAAHGMLEVLEQSSRYEPPAAPPFELRPVELPVSNPIVAVHEEIEAFLTENVSD